MSIALLAGCATVPTPSLVVSSAPVTRVEVPVVSPCLRPDQIEPLPPSSMPSRASGVAELASGAAADAVKYRLLAQRQADMLKACATKPESK